jgi:hypothetical protein
MLRYQKMEYHINELVSSHMMRRTTITVVLGLRMSESAVRAISGHAPNSKEFYKYVAYCQNIQNEETDRMFARLINAYTNTPAYLIQYARSIPLYWALKSKVYRTLYIH